MKLGERSHLGKARIVVGLILGTITSNLWQPLVCAQITPDNTLGTESSVINSNVELNEKLVELIEGGAIRDANLFHSFEQFNLAEGQNVYFANPAGISNILTRVTGKDASNIFGTLGVNGTANLFLLNPNGIVFGENARLDVAGSFVGSTANGIAFENGFSFSSVFPEAVPLLRINIPVGLQYGANPGRIIVQGDGQGLRATTDLIDTLTGLRVPPNQTLALVGGEMELSGGTLKTAGGRIELGSITQSGLVTLTPIAQGWVLGYDGIKNFGDIELSQQAAVDASGTGGGDIQVRGRRVSLSDGSQIEGATLGSEAGGSLTVNATESVQVIGRSADGEFPSGLGTQSAPGSTGNTGDLTISTPTLLIQDGAEVSANTFASGAGGNLTVNATESVQVIGESDDGEFGSNLITQAEPGSTGNAGDLTISTPELLIADGAQVSASTFAEGAGGNLTVNATESVQVIGRSADGELGSNLSVQTNLGSTGNAGDLTISTPTLLISDGAFVSANTFGEGAGGSLIVNATESVQVIGESDDGEFGSNLITQAEPGSTGNAGDLTISTPELLIADGAQVSASTFAEGAGGNLTVNATESVQVIGTSADGRFSSGLFAGTLGTGDAGDLTISTPELLIQDGAGVSAGTFAEGAGGNLTVNATESVQMIGNSADGQISSLNALAQGTGNAGNLTISTPELLIQDGAQVATATVGEGDGGSLMVNATESVQLMGTSSDGQFSSGLFVQTNGKGNAGNLNITTEQLSIQDEAVVSARSLGEGNSGDIEIQAGSLSLDNQGTITGTTRTGDGGNITIKDLDLLLLRRGSQISTTAGTAESGGDGGDINIAADLIVAIPQENSDITANAFTGQGGNVQITAQGIFGIKFRPAETSLSDITASSEFGLSGTVVLNIPDVDVLSGLVKLPEQLISVQPWEGCRTTTAQSSSFVRTGKGGLPSNPDRLLESTHVLDDLSLPQGWSEAASEIPNKIVEATSWIVNEEGAVELIAHKPNCLQSQS